MSLITNLHVSRDANDVFLIDEPEVHLNWHLEERIFDFFQRFCERHDKQMIVVTHSRIVFTDRFLPVTTFFYWADGRIAWGNEMPLVQRERIAGEANGAFFLEDGDNQGSLSPGEPDFIHLDKYRVENYLLDLPTASIATGRDETELRQGIFDEVVKRRDRILGKNKWLEFLFDGLQPEDLTADRMAKLDASVIIDGYPSAIRLARDDYLDRYLNAADQQGSLDSIFPNGLVEAIRQSTPNEPRTAP